jgi:hypothetical protein
VSYALAAFLWACFQMHFKGDLALRLLMASALFVFVSVLSFCLLYWYKSTNTDTSSLRHYLLHLLHLDLEIF